MAIELNALGDLAHVDGLEAVTLEGIGSSGSISINGALRRAVNTREAAASNGHYQRGDTVWHLPADGLGVEPCLGCVLIDNAGVRWTVLEVSRQTLGSRWRLITRAVEIRGGLDERITIQVAEWRAGRGGDARPTWKDWRCGVTARIQPEAAEVAVEAHRRHTQTDYRIYLADNLELTRDHRIVAADGRIYAIDRVERAERLGELVVVHARRLDTARSTDGV